MKIHTYVSIKQYRFFETRSGLYISSCPSVHTFTLTSVIPPVQGFPMCPVCFAIFNTEVDIYKRKQENTLSTKKVIKKKKKIRKENSVLRPCKNVTMNYNIFLYFSIYFWVFPGALFPSPWYLLILSITHFYAQLFPFLCVCPKRNLPGSLNHNSFASSELSQTVPPPLPTHPACAPSKKG